MDSRPRSGMEIAEGIMTEDDQIVASEWFPAANLDYYVARPLGMEVFGLGTPQDIHKYLWINDIRGGFEVGESFWFLSDSRYYKDPKDIYRWGNFAKTELLGVIPIERCGKTAKNFFVFKCENLRFCPKGLDEMKAENGLK